ncbi:hypothetical protein [Almyronema epifaneia]|uniref:DUF3887 domain-containing protein n=1 Tax=Almyronema epifaneia S1 TaxID=2991925 RepID=A0ABW6IBE2_9CYAN
MVHYSDHNYPRQHYPHPTPPSVSPRLASRAVPSGRSPMRRRQRRPAKAFIAGGSILALAALVVSPKSAQNQQTQAEVCTQVIQESARLSRDELTQLISIPQTSSRAAVEDLLQEPYCLLPTKAAEVSGPLERQAYPLEFDIDTWLVVEYTDNQYVGYDFSFRK